MKISSIKPINAIIATAVAGSLGLFSAAPALAQTTPSYATAGDQTIRGTIGSINGKYNISIHDVRGYLDNVTLHPGTIINPTGLELAPGQSVTIVGTPDGNTFAANEIDTPYEPLAVVPGYYGYPWGGPDFGIGFGFGHFGFRGR